MRYLLSLSLICLMSCSAFKKGNSANGNSNKMDHLKSSSWTIVSITGFELEKTHQPVTIAFTDDNRVGGSTGCNSYGGPYTIEDDHLSFGQIISTQKACIPGIQTEAHYLEVLQKTNRYELKNNQLILKNDDVVLATFSRVKK